MTNKEWLLTLSTEELASWVTSLFEQTQYLNLARLEITKGFVEKWLESEFMDFRNDTSLTQREMKGEKRTMEKTDERKRKFIDIVVQYPTICPYLGYKDKPYFSIRYEENGELFEGFGTYKPEVLSEYLKEYFLPPVQPKHTGRWVYDGCGTKCSACGMYAYKYTFDRPWKSPFCPICGAKMEEEK